MKNKIINNNKMYKYRKIFLNSKTLKDFIERFDLAQKRIKQKEHNTC